MFLRTLHNLWKDDCGATQAVEWLILTTILVLGIIPGIAIMRNSLNKTLEHSARMAMAGIDDDQSNRDQNGRPRGRTSVQQNHGSQNNGGVGDLCN